MDEVFFDGQCGLCHRSVRFMLARDRRGERFVFAPLQGETFAASAPANLRLEVLESMVIHTSDGRWLTRSAAVLRMLERCGGGWWLLARVARVVPTAWLDRAYDAVGARRQRWFARPAGLCPIVPKELAGRFKR